MKVHDIYQNVMAEGAFNPDDGNIFYFISCTIIIGWEPWPAVKVNVSSE